MPAGVLEALRGEARELLSPRYAGLLRSLDDQGATPQEYNASIHTQYIRTLQGVYGEALEAIRKRLGLLKASERNLRSLGRACEIFSAEVVPSAATVCKEAESLRQAAEDKQAASELVGSMEYVLSWFLGEDELGGRAGEGELAVRVGRLGATLRSLSGRERLQRAASRFSSLQFADQTLFFLDIYGKTEALQLVADVLRGAGSRGGGKRGEEKGEREGGVEGVESAKAAEGPRGREEGGAVAGAGRAEPHRSSNLCESRGLSVPAASEALDTAALPAAAPAASSYSDGLSSNLVSLCSALREHLISLAQLTLEAYCSRLAVLLKLGIQDGLFQPQPESLAKQREFCTPCRLAYFFSVSRYRFLLSEVQGHAQASFFPAIRGDAESCASVVQRLYDVTLAYVKYYTTIFGSAEDVCAVLSGVSTQVTQLCASLIQEGKLGVAAAGAGEKHGILPQFGPSRRRQVFPGVIRDFIVFSEKLSIVQEFCAEIRVPLDRGRDSELLGRAQHVFAEFKAALPARGVPLLSELFPAESGRRDSGGQDEGICDASRAREGPSAAQEGAAVGRPAPRSEDRDCETEHMLSYTLGTILSLVAGALRVEFSRRVASASFFDISSPLVLEECERVLLDTGSAPPAGPVPQAASDAALGAQVSKDSSEAPVSPGASKTGLTHALVMETLDTMVRICADSGSQQSYPATIGILLSVNRMAPSVRVANVLNLQLSQLLAKLIVQWYSVHKGNEYSGALAASAILRAQDLPTYFRKMQDAVFREARRLVGRELSDELLLQAWGLVGGGR